jgi:hypothetical protein
VWHLERSQLYYNIVQYAIKKVNELQYKITKKTFGNYVYIAAPVHHSFIDLVLFSEKEAIASKIDIISECVPSYR